MLVSLVEQLLYLILYPEHTKYFPSCSLRYCKLYGWFICSPGELVMQLNFTGLPVDNEIKLY